VHFSPNALLASFSLHSSSARPFIPLQKTESTLSDVASERPVPSSALIDDCAEDCGPRHLRSLSLQLASVEVEAKKVSLP